MDTFPLHIVVPYSNFSEQRISACDRWIEQAMNVCDLVRRDSPLTRHTDAFTLHRVNIYRGAYRTSLISNTVIHPLPPFRVILISIFDVPVSLFPTAFRNPALTIDVSQEYLYTTCTGHVLQGAALVLLTFHLRYPAAPIAANRSSTRDSCYVFAFAHVCRQPSLPHHHHHRHYA